MRITIIHPNKAYLPELSAYTSYFTKHSHHVNVVTSKEHFSKCDLEWKILGQDYNISSATNLLIHDYRGVPIPPLSLIKTAIKVRIFRKPNLRIFLNRMVMEAYSFRDSVPALIVDMGVDPSFIMEKKKNVYNAIYVGEITRRRRLGDFLREFAIGSCRRYTILIVGHPPNSIYNSFVQYKNISFSGRVPYHEVPALLGSASVGINMIPLVYPFSIQTSTKFLEYMASGLQTISNAHPPSLNLARKLGYPLHLITSVNELGNAMRDALASTFQLSSEKLVSLTWPSVFQSANLNERVEALRSSDLLTSRYSGAQ